MASFVIPFFGCWNNVTIQNYFSPARSVPPVGPHRVQVSSKTCQRDSEQEIDRDAEQSGDKKQRQCCDTDRGIDLSFVEPCEVPQRRDNGETQNNVDDHQKTAPPITDTANVRGSLLVFWI